MNLQNQIILVVFVVMALTFGTFAWLVFGLPGNVRSGIDQELETTVRQMVSDATSNNGIELEEIDWPNTMSSMAEATGFYTVLDADEEIVKQSPNFPLEVPISAELGSFEADVLDVRVIDQTLRVVNYPIIGNFEDEQRILGYLQVARPMNDIANLRRLTTVLVLVGGASLSLATFILAFVMPYSLRKLDAIVETTERINSAEDLTMRIPHEGGTGNVEQLVLSFNQLLERLETLFKTQQRLLADVSHELRTPLTAIRGNVDLIRRVGADEESLESIEMEVERMTRLVTDLLTLARAEGGGLPIREEVVDLDRLFLETFEQVSLIDSPVRVILRDVDVARVIGDPDRLKQLMLNLMTNAIKYTDKGGHVTVGLTTAAENAYIHVEDTGIGIPAQDLPHIFERFYRVSKSRARAGRGGAGLGLAIVQSITQAHNGDIAVTSEVGVGTTFTVRIPLLNSAEFEPAF